MTGFEYRVDAVRESLGGKFHPRVLEQLLNKRAGEGWRLRSIVGADVKGIIGSAEGLMLVFERAVEVPERQTPPPSVQLDEGIRGLPTD